MNFIHNPILTGFNPDPSILRVGDDYYIATSTFEWFPGVQIHHSKDLGHWQLITRPLDRITQLNMTGVPNSGGIWAPCLPYSAGSYYLIYTITKSFNSIFQDCHNYLVTAPDIYGPWSEPIYLNSSGFDPSLFHDDDGRKWLVNMVRDHRQQKKTFGGILLQEYSLQEKKLIGPITNIFRGTDLGFTEGPHLYKHNGCYCLLTAEGGTELGHAVTMARSKTITGPYEIDPENPMLTSRNSFTTDLKKAGHASIVETQTGEWYLVHLCGRPLPSNGRCILGRETCIQKVVWNRDGWLRLESGGHNPQTRVQAPYLPEYIFNLQPILDHFDSEDLNIHFQTLRVPLSEEYLSLKERPGFLRLYGSESLISLDHQALIARRQQAFCFTASTCLEFEPDNFQQMAGLVCFYNTNNFYYLRVSRDEMKGKCLNIIANDRNKFSELLDHEISIDGWRQCYLRVTVNYERLQFYYSDNDVDWEPIGSVLDASILADENCIGLGFTGAFVGMCCQDLSGRRKKANFDFFEYEEHDS